jgi:hypothetical protein
MRDPAYRFGKPERRVRMRNEIWTRYYHEEDFAALACAKLKGYGEGRGVRIFDEAHNRINNRDWKDELQRLVLRRLSVARHVGWDDYVITQHAKNVDVAIRRLADVEIRVIDWQRLMRIPIFNAKLLPFHFFLAQHFPVEETSVPGVSKLGRSQAREIFFLGWWRNLYDTHAEIRFNDDLDDDGRGLVLPRLLSLDSRKQRETRLGAIPSCHTAGIALRLSGYTSFESEIDAASADLHFNPSGEAPGEMAPHQPEAGAISPASES